MLCDSVNPMQSFDEIHLRNTEEFAVLTDSLLVKNDTPSDFQKAQFI